MKKSSVISAVLLLAAVSLAQSVFAEGDSAATAAAVEKADKDRNAALVKGDAAAVDKLTADTYIFTDPTGRVTAKPALMEAFKSGAIKIQSQEISDVKVHVYGNVAVETGELRAKASRDGQDTSGTYRFTRVWASRNGAWQTVAFQETRLGPAP